MNMVYNNFLKRCTEYQNNPKLKLHIKINIILIVLTTLLRVLFEIFTEELFGYQNPLNEIESVQQSQDSNRIQNNFQTFQRNSQLLYNILDQLLHLFLSLEIIILGFQITLLINKRKQENPIHEQLLPVKQKVATCSVEILKSSDYGISSMQNNQPTFNPIEMQDLSRNKGSVKHSNIISPLQNKISENCLAKENKIIPNKNQEIIYSRLLGRGQKQINGIYVNIYIIQKCQKKENCNFFWISQSKSTNYVCINCDQQNMIMQIKDDIKQNQKLQNFEPSPVLLSNKFEEQLYELYQGNKNKMQTCVNFDFCGYFWVQDSKIQCGQYYCQICMDTFWVKRESTVKEIICRCSYCNQETSEYFQSSCLHPYHFECIKELGQIQNKTKILCVICNVNLTSSLKKYQLLPNTIFEKIFSNQIQTIMQEKMHEGTDDLE